ncbi:MAG: hypothetical protein QG670_2785 [Thermoproteota archaeon]|nr:hypothetical protein [Thermoproteota archaeon]
MIYLKLNALRNLSKDEAFNFYASEWNYLKINATSLEEFMDKLKGISAESINFHLNRGDFEKWIDGSVGDKTLSKQIAELRTRNLQGAKARIELSNIVLMRIKTLKK